MNDIYANPVEIKRKDIYIIRNTINEKVYIGQAVNTKKRFQGHCSNKKDNSIIDAAIRKYGKENFYYQILEEQIEDYDEKEKYYIKFFNSLAPNGYNILDGGQNPPCLKGVNNPTAKFNEQQLQELEILLQKPLTFAELSAYFGVSEGTIRAINSGRTYYREGINYPIRKKRLNGQVKDVISDELVKKIINDIKNTEISLRKIGEKYNVKYSTIKSICNGTALYYYQEFEKYPLRECIKLDKEKIDNIYNLLLNTNLSDTDIAKKIGIKQSVVSSIKRGDSYQREGYIYPLRQNKYHLEESDFEQIRQLLKNKKTNQEILIFYPQLTNAVIQDINSGKSHKSVNYNYPIRNLTEKLNQDEIKKIIDLISNTKLSLREIGNQFNVSLGLIINIKNGVKKYRQEGLSYPLRPTRKK